MFTSGGAPSRTGARLERICGLMDDPCDGPRIRSRTALVKNIDGFIFDKDVFVDETWEIKLGKRCLIKLNVCKD